MSPLFLQPFLAKGPCSVQACHMSSLFLRPFSKTSLFKRLISFLSLSASEQNIPVQFKLLTCYPYSLSAFYSSSKASLLSTSARQTVPVRLTRFGKMSLYHSPIHFGNTVLFAHHFGKRCLFSSSIEKEAPGNSSPFPYRLAKPSARFTHSANFYFYFFSLVFV